EARPRRARDRRRVRVRPLARRRARGGPGARRRRAARLGGRVRASLVAGRRRRLSTLTFPHVRLELDGAVATLVLAHPEVLNAISPAMLGGLLDAMDAVEDPARGVRCLLVTGEGRAFSAGATLAGDGPSTRANDAGAVLETHYHPLFRRLRDLAMPVVTAVNGVAAGVGMSLALHGDLVLAARS